MRDGFIKVAACTPQVQVADCEYNASQIIGMAKEAGGQGAKVIVMPELCITSYTCGDLFWQELLLEEAKVQLLRIAEETEHVDAVVFVGLPLEYRGKLYNVAAGICHGEILGFVPKQHIPNYNEFYEGRYFASGKGVDGMIRLKPEPRWEELPDDETEEDFCNCEVCISPYLLFTCPQVPNLKIAAEICEDLWVPNPPGIAHAYHGANLIVNLSASDEVVGKDSYRKKSGKRPVCALSLRLYLRNGRRGRIYPGCCLRRTEYDRGKRCDSGREYTFCQWNDLCGFGYPASGK